MLADRSAASVSYRPIISISILECADKLQSKTRAQNAGFRLQCKRKIELKLHGENVNKMKMCQLNSCLFFFFPQHVFSINRTVSISIFLSPTLSQINSKTKPYKDIMRYGAGMGHQRKDG